ncbi:MAG TPA: cytochrome c3 family protein [Verrucomicrobiae bacterium]|nr:cytochrome c3 family protein [Verrucomicrobiae bacterium]
MKTFLTNLKPMGRASLRAICLCVLFSAASLRAESVVNTVHNLSATGPGTVKASTESQVCIFCHTPHRANGQTPLWNHNMSGVTNYIVYSSPTLKAVVGQPNGSSRLCLSCHDGTVALGSVNSRTATIQMQNGVTTMPDGAANLGTDLSGDHPISFVYDSALVSLDPKLNDPSTLPAKVKLDQNHEMQCASCHNPHDNQFGNFLVMDNTGSALCVVCHNDPNWPTSAHAMSPQVLTANVMAKIAPETRAVSGAKVNPSANTVAALGCDNCHQTHTAGGKRFLMKSDALEQNCLVCHNGNLPSQKNVAADFQKISVHPITLGAAAHAANEDPVNPPSRHVTCTDCHNPHAMKSGSQKAGELPGALAGVEGVSASGAVVNPVVHEYELCFRCHADSVARGPATVTRQFVQTNTRLQFSTANQSFHPVEQIGKNQNMPSLIAPMTAQSQITCTDCHNSDSSPAAGGSGANGPHGSIFAPLLERNLNTQDFQAESAQAYALCYKCHDRGSILANQSFKFHSTHVVNDQTACTTCHDSHGVTDAPHLINFNTTYVTPSSSGRIEYVSTGFLHGNCTLTCHGKDHQATPY